MSHGAATTRIETFFDAAFAFAIILLVISVGSIPENYEELILALKKIPSFALSFAGIIWVWMGHRRWGRWYGMEDGKSMVLTLVLIFIMLVYVYPLRLVFSTLYAALMPLKIVVYEAFAYSTLSISMPLLSIHFDRKSRQLIS